MHHGIAKYEIFTTFKDHKKANTFKLELFCCYGNTTITTVLESEMCHENQLFYKN